MAKRVLQDLVDSFEVTGDAKSSPVDEAREALRREALRDIEKAYASSTNIRQAEYPSVGHVVTGLFEFMVETLYNLWEPVKGFMNSTFVRDSLEFKTGKAMSLGQYFERMAEEGTIPANSIDGFKKLDKLIVALADYSARKKKTPDKVLRSSRDCAALMKQVYGSIDAYEENIASSMKGMLDLTGKLELVENLPMEKIIANMLESKTDYRLDEFGIDVSAVGRAVQGYSLELARFGKTMIGEYAKIVAKKAESYRRADKKSSK